MRSVVKTGGPTRVESSLTGVCCEAGRCERSVKPRPRSQFIFKLDFCSFLLLLTDDTTLIVLQISSNVNLDVVVNLKFVYEGWGKES